MTVDGVWVPGLVLALVSLGVSTFLLFADLRTSQARLVRTERHLYARRTREFADSLPPAGPSVGRHRGVL